MNKTALQRLIDDIDLRIDNVNRLSNIGDNIQMLTTLKVIKENAERLLSLEKQQIIEAMATAIIIPMAIDKAEYLKEAEQYYNDTFKQE